LNSFLSQIIVSPTKKPIIVTTIENQKQKEKKKKYISATLKRLVWNKWIGEDIGKAKCLCCNVTAITQLSFHAGHIIAESNGGETNVSNLKPICQNCNSSMGTKNMIDFMKSFE
jgi:5-methylcytosine-specific restriction endonuclease McrA